MPLASRTLTEWLMDREPLLAGAGNEPDLLAPWLYAFAGEAALPKVGRHTRWLAERMYADAPSGLPGNDDYGTLSAWQVWAQLGLYPLAGSDKFVLGAPRFSEVHIGLGAQSASDGDEARGDAPQAAVLRVVAHNASASHTRVLRAEVNGRTIDLAAPFVRFADLLNEGRGGRLEVWMAEE